MANTYLTKTFSSGGNQRIWTLSFWVKLNRGTGEDNYILTYAQGSGATPRGSMEFRSNANGNGFRLGLNPTGSSWINCDVDNRKFRDYSAFYHVVVAVDTTQATASNRVKIYINGEQQTVSTQPSQNLDTGFNHTHQTSFGRYENADSAYFDGVLSHINFIDGTQYPASSFGSTDSTTGAWEINTSPSVTYGSNGYFILKDGNSVTDQSGNSNNFTVAGGTLTNTEDCPSNNFATMNPLNVQSTGYTITNGNNSITGNSGNAWRSLYGTLGASTGKFYWEQKINGNADTSHIIGISDIDKMKNSNDNDFENVSTDAYGYRPDGAKISKNTLSAGYGNTYTNNDIIGVAVDLDNSKIYFSKNGVWQNSGDPTSGATGTGSAYTITSGVTYTATTSTNAGGNTFSYNFGNGYFGTTAISSEGTNASGIGKFEYDVPAGFTALSTKGLNL